MVGSTRSGKSTLSEALLDIYHTEHPTHSIYIIDPKQRFRSVDLDADEPYQLFPDGYKAYPNGRLRSVSIVADIIDKPRKPEGSYVRHPVIVQNNDAIFKTVDWLYENSDVQQPSILYCDESFDFQRGVRADPTLRKLLQQGGERGIGLLIINQRPKWIDKTLLSETEGFYIGRLNHFEDREYMYDECQPAPEHIKTALDNWMNDYEWIFIDKKNWNNSKHFRLQFST